jgi:hypothetical protein
MKKLIVFLILFMVFLCSGCGIISVIGTPTRHERVFVAEYDLTEHTNQKVLVLVHQPVYLGAEANLRYHLTETMNKSLIKEIEMPSAHLVSYDELSEFRSNKPGFSLLSSAEVGTALGADMVLLVVIEDYQLSEMAESGYHKGFLAVQSVLLDTATGEKLWPESAKSKSIKVGFEFEDGGQEAALARLAGSLARCTVRYFYDCPKNKFKIADDRSGAGWENW